MAQIGEAFAAHFKGRGITKVVTIESSGIAPALMTASALGVPMVILKKQPSQILNDNLYQTVITSFTKETNYELTLSKKYISEEDHVLIIDDFLANGEAATGAIRLLRLAHATIAGLGVLVEKSFQPGRKKADRSGYRSVCTCQSRCNGYRPHRIFTGGRRVIFFPKEKGLVQ